MKNLINIIQEKLKINSKTNINNSKLLDILDVNINSIEQLNEVITKYVEESKCNAFVDGVVRAYNNSRNWQTLDGFTLDIKEEFLVYIYEDNKGAEVSKFRFGIIEAGGPHFVIKLQSKRDNDNKWKQYEIQGAYSKNELNEGDNLLDFLIRTINSMEKNDVEYKEYTNLFKDI